MATPSSPENGGKFQAEFTAGKIKYTVTVTEAGSITWIQTGNEESRETVPRDEILAISSLTKKETDEAGGFKLSYIEHQKKRILRPAHFSFTGTSENCQQMVDKVQDLINKAPMRPRKALVIINPVSGSGKGVQVFETKVAPIFASFGLTTNVIVTERPRQAGEIMSDYDLDSIDSIVTVGGDGIYHEVANGLLLRTQKEAGIDVNDPEAHLKGLTIPIGLIPTGTGNGIARSCYGTFDGETAALAIIRGRRTGSNVCSLYCGGEFQVFAILLIGYGIWGDAVYTAEQKRHLGRWRHLVATFDTLLLRSPRVMDLKMEYLKPETVEEPNMKSADTACTNTQENTGEERTRKQVEASAMDNPESPESEQKSVTVDSSEVCPGIGASRPEPKFVWQEEEKGSIGVIFSNSDMYGTILGLGSPADSGALLVNRPCTTWQLLKFFFRIVTFSKYLLEGGTVDHTFLYGLRVKLNTPSTPESDAGRKEHVLFVDGELITVKEPEFEVRLHRGTITLFYGVDGLTGFLDTTFYP